MNFQSWESSMNNGNVAVALAHMFVSNSEALLFLKPWGDAEEDSPPLPREEV